MKHTHTDCRQFVCRPDLYGCFSLLISLSLSHSHVVHSSHHLNTCRVDTFEYNDVITEERDFFQALKTLDLSPSLSLSPSVYRLTAAFKCVNLRLGIIECMFTAQRPQQPLNIMQKSHHFQYCCYLSDYNVLVGAFFSPTPPVRPANAHTCAHNKNIWNGQFLFSEYRI